MSCYYYPSVYVRLMLIFVVVYCSDPPPIKIPGSLNIAFLLDIHTNGDDNQLCSEVNPTAVEQLLASVWATRVLNAEDSTNNSDIGITIYDTCGSADVATRQIFRILEINDENEGCSCQNRSKLLGIIGVAETDVLFSMSNILNAFSMPFVIASPGGRDISPKSHNILVTSPGLVSQIKILASLLKTFQWNTVRVVSSSAAALNEFTTIVKSTDVVMTQSLLISNNQIDVDSVKRLLQKEDEQIIVIALLSPAELHRLAKIISQHPTNDVMWIIASPSLDRNDLKQIGPVLGPGIFLETHSAHLPRLQSFLIDCLSHGTNITSIDPLMNSFAEEKFNCSRNSTKFQQSCREKFTKENLQNVFLQHPGANHVADAVSVLASAFRIVVLDSCEEGSMCDAVEPIGPKMLTAMRKVGFSFRKDLQPQVEGVQFRFTESGRLVTVHSHIIFYNNSQEPILIGWYSDELGVSLNSFPASFIKSRLDNNEYQHMMSDRINHSRRTPHTLLTDEISYNIHVERISHNLSVRRPWAAATLVLAGLGILGTIYILVYVVLRIYDGTLAGNQFFAICLLMSVAILYCTCIVFVFPSSAMTCAIRLVLHPTAHMFCYSVLLVKIMALRSIVQLGLGGSISFINLLITLIAFLLVQLVVVVQWLLMSPFPFFDVICSIPNRTFLLLHIPAIFVLAFTTIFGFFCRHIRRNYQQVISLVLVCIVCIPVWVAWIILLYSAPPIMLEPAICAHLLTIATVVLLGVFVPKLRTLSQQSSSFDHKTLKSNNKPVTTAFHSSTGDSILRHPLHEHKLQTIYEK